MTVGEYEALTSGDMVLLLSPLWLLGLALVGVVLGWLGRKLAELLR